MSDRLKENNGEEEVKETSEETADIGETDNEDEQLAEELEQLRQTFQTALDETVEEAENAPVIQELEPGENTEDDEEEEDGEESEHQSHKKPKKKGKRAAGKVVIGLVIAGLALLVLIFGTCTVGFISNPNLMSFISAVGEAGAAETSDEKLEGYKNALKYCEGDNKFNSLLKGMVYENMLDIKLKDEGKIAAYSYLTKVISEEEAEKISSAKIKKLYNSIEEIRNVTENVIVGIIEKSDENGLVDIDAVYAENSVSADIKESLTETAESVSKSLEKSAAAKELLDFSKAGNMILDAVSKLSDIGLDYETASQKIAVALYNKGYIYEAFYITGNILSSEENISDEYKAIKDDVKELAKLETPYSLAEKIAFGDDISESGKVSDFDDVKKAVAEETKLTGAKLEFYSQIVFDCIKAIECAEAKDITSASTKAITSLSAENLVGIQDTELSFLYIKTQFTLNMYEALTYAPSVMTDEIVAMLSEEKQEEYKEMQLAFDAYEATFEIFYPYYASYYQSGTMPDFDSLKSDLDTYLEKESNNYSKGFCAYWKYVVKRIAKENDAAVRYILEAKELMPGLITMFASEIIDCYTEENDMTSAVRIAKEVLEVNSSDIFALSTLAVNERMNGNVDGALETALKAADSSNSQNYCAREAAIDNMLKKDYEDAYKYLRIYYDSIATYQNATYKDLVSACELVYILNGIYDGTGETKDELTALMKDIDTLYSTYQLEHLSESKAIVSGEKTFEEIFLDGNYNFDYSADEKTE